MSAFRCKNCTSLSAIQPILDQFKVENCKFFKMSNYTVVTHCYKYINVKACISETVQDSLKFLTDMDFLRSGLCTVQKLSTCKCK
jgi:hypothetical protein